jgi:hypothetical protein
MAQNEKRKSVVDAAYISTVELRALWETGFPLNHAWMEFTEGFLGKCAFKMLRTHPSNDAAVADDPRDQKLNGWLPSTSEDRQKKFFQSPSL